MKVKAATISERKNNYREVDREHTASMPIQYNQINSQQFKRLSLLT